MWKFSIDSPEVVNGVDYHTLTYQKRSINLDTVLAPAKKIVTGVRFHALDDGVLTIQIRCTDFDYETGELNNLHAHCTLCILNENIKNKCFMYLFQLNFANWLGRLKNLDKSIWISNEEQSMRTELLLDEPDSPIRSGIGSNKPLEPNWTRNQYIKFGPTDRIKDAAQLTVPFLDGTFVEGNPTILSGIGIYYKGRPGSGGFIAPYLVGFDFGSLINPIQLT